MFFEGTVATDVYRTEMPLVERKAALRHRTRHMRAPETKAAIAVINTVLSAVLGIFLR
jgi:hypothetical protein